MYLDYVRTFLSADERLTEKQRDVIAERIVRWAEENRVEDLGRLHDELADWVDRGPIREQYFVSVEQHIGEEGDLRILKDPSAKAAPEILIAGTENIITGEELHKFISKEEPQLADLAGSILKVNGDAVYREGDLDPTQIQHRLTAVASRVRNGKLIVPNKEVLSVGFDAQGNLQVRYKRGYSDEKFQRVLEMRLGGSYQREIVDVVGVSRQTIGDWLHSCGLGGYLPRYQRNIMREEGRRNLVEAKILGFVDRFYRENGIGPTVSQISSAVDCSERRVGNCVGKLLLLSRSANMRGRGTKYIILPYHADPRHLIEAGWILLSTMPPVEERTAVYGFIREYKLSNGIGPRIEEIQKAVRFDPFQALDYLRQRRIVSRNFHTDRYS